MSAMLSAQDSNTPPVARRCIDCGESLASHPAPIYEQGRGYRHWADECSRKGVAEAQAIRAAHGLALDLSNRRAAAAINTSRLPRDLAFSCTCDQAHKGLEVGGARAPGSVSCVGCGRGYTARTRQEAIDGWNALNSNERAAARVIGLERTILVLDELRKCAELEGGKPFLRRLREANVQRCESAMGFHHQLNGWSALEWAGAVCGEAGELANVAKKMRRQQPGDPSVEECRRRLADEAADVLTYLDLLLAREGIDLQEAVVRKFNEVSKRVGYVDGAGDQSMVLR